MAKYYCVLFDADNTLLNFDAAESKALAETLVNYGIEPDAETVQTYRTINSELWRQLEKGQIKREKLMAERFTRFLKAIDAAGDGSCYNQKDYVPCRAAYAPVWCCGRTAYNRFRCWKALPPCR